MCNEEGKRSPEKSDVFEQFSALEGTTKIFELYYIKQPVCRLIGKQMDQNKNND